MTKIFIFNNASRAAGYGIGTYVKQLSDGLSVMPDTKVSFVEMYADTKEFAIFDDENGIRHYLIPPLHSGTESEMYCRIIFYFLARSIEADKNDNIVFQFNYFQHYSLAVLLKSWFINSCIVLTVHYMNWCFELNGNVRRMRAITAEGYEPEDDKERGVVASFTNERVFLHLADVVLVLSIRTREILADDYSVSAYKMHLVYNGIGDSVYKKLFPQNNKHVRRNVLYVGRLDEIKGLKYLISAFEKVVEKHADIQLVIVGDGDFQPYMEQCRKIQGHVSFLGKMQSDDVDKVYSSACIGVMPSFHEQCSYTAIEMMRHGVPVIGTDSTGLAEMLDATPELRVHIDEENFSEDEFVSQIASRMDLLLSDETAYHVASDAVRKQYEERYTQTAMTRSVQEAVQILQVHSTDIVSPDYLPHIDKQMIGLINRRPDIDLDFYGMTGIGVYLWWRVLQLEKDAVANANQLAMIKEHLVYYIDWVDETIDDTPLGAELYEMLVSMSEHVFYPTMVENILRNGKVTCDNTTFPSEDEILHNTLKICTCKI